MPLLSISVNQAPMKISKYWDSPCSDPTLNYLLKYFNVLSHSHLGGRNATWMCKFALIWEMDMLLVCENLFSSAFTDIWFFFWKRHSPAFYRKQMSLKQTPCSYMLFRSHLDLWIALAVHAPPGLTRSSSSSSGCKRCTKNFSTSRLKNQYAGAKVSATSITLMVLMGYKKQKGTIQWHRNRSY